MKPPSGSLRSAIQRIWERSQLTGTATPLACNSIAWRNSKGDGRVGGTYVLGLEHRFCGAATREALHDGPVR